MEELFKLSPEELSKICIKAEFDEDGQFIIDEENCIHKDGFMLFKRPIYVKRGHILSGVISRIILVKREKEDSNQMYLFAMTESSSDKDRELLHDFFDIEDCKNKGCITLRTRSANWMPCGYLREVDL